MEKGLALYKPSSQDSVSKTETKERKPEVTGSQNKVQGREYGEHVVRVPLRLHYVYVG